MYLRIWTFFWSHIFKASNDLIDIPSDEVGVSVAVREGLSCGFGFFDFVIIMAAHGVFFPKEGHVPGVSIFVDDVFAIHFQAYGFL